MSNRSSGLIELALRSSARSAGGWSLEPASLRQALHVLGRRTDQVLVGGAVTHLILATAATIPVFVAIFVGGFLLGDSWFTVAEYVSSTILMLPIGAGAVLALWRAGYEWFGRARQRPFVVRYGADPNALLQANILGVLVAIARGGHRRRRGGVPALPQESTRSPHGAGRGSDRPRIRAPVRLRHLRAGDEPALGTPALRTEARSAKGRPPTASAVGGRKVSFRCGLCPRPDTDHNCALGGRLAADLPIS
jgi:hypothetical protein